MKKLKLYDSKEYLELMFVKKNMSPEEIAKEIKCSPITVRERLKKFGLMR